MQRVQCQAGGDARNFVSIKSQGTPNASPALPGLGHKPLKSSNSCFQCILLWMFLTLDLETLMRSRDKVQENVLPI